MKAVVLTPRGPFSLAASLRFLEGFTPARYEGGHDGVLRLAFPSDGGRFTATATVRQEPSPDGTGAVRALLLALACAGPNGRARESGWGCRSRVKRSGGSRAGTARCSASRRALRRRGCPRWRAGRAGAG
ncbi:hypothetical protein [Streptomyces sp. NPDC001530]|uniref:hypothetical protein n=1 Tax=Streptomyces sp. NPDC001530 TaxID=3364582 RepID=UPI00369929E6